VDDLANILFPKKKKKKSVRKRIPVTRRRAVKRNFPCRNKSPSRKLLWKEEKKKKSA
jgi:hypothetical protein